MNGHKHTFSLETGTDCTIRTIFHKVTGKDTPSMKSSFKLVAYSHHQMVPLGVAKLKYEYKSEVHESEFQIIKANSAAGLQHIHINRAVTLVVRPPTKVPLALQDKIKCELEGMEKKWCGWKTDRTHRLG